MSVSTPSKSKLLQSALEDITPRDALRRFSQLQTLRLKRIQSLVLPKQQIFLDILPLLFHQNIALFPGYSGVEVPCGIINYGPDTESIKAAKKFSNAYHLKSLRMSQFSIDAIFLMGSVSSIAFAKSSVMDIWVCYQSKLDETQRQALQVKAEKVEKWAASLGLVVHILLTDSAAFLQAGASPLSRESSGQVQHHLLLEEFYRNAIHIAGKMPAWWLIPPQEEQNYSAYLQHLQKNRFIPESEIIDLGGFEQVAPSELINATLWHLYKALDTPHQSLLKLWLMECYASEYPQPDWLCLHLKQAVYKGMIDVDALDPYALMYRKIERYLQRYSNRLLLARQCFYLNIMGSAESPKAGRQSPAQAMRAAFIKRIVQEANWPSNLIPEILNQKAWTITKATWEFGIIQAQLRQTYKLIQGFSQQYAQTGSGALELQLIRRKLTTCLSPKAGKVALITTSRSILTQEIQVSLLEHVIAPGKAEWYLYAGQVTASEQYDVEPLIKVNSLLEALVWLVINGVYHKQLALHLSTQTLNLPATELLKICEQVQQVFKQPLENLGNSLALFRKPDAEVLVLAFVNFGQDNAAPGQQDGKLRISQQSDAFRYGSQQRCLIERIDCLSLSRWGQLSISQYQGVDGIFDWLCDRLNALEKPWQNEQVQVMSNVPVLGKSMTQRLKTLVEQTALALKQAKGGALRYVLAAGKSYYCLQRQAGQFNYLEIQTKAQLLKTLASPLASETHTVFDLDLGLNSILPDLFKRNQMQCIQVFYLRSGLNMNVYILDERGALSMQQHPNVSLEQVHNRYATFLHAMLKRYYVLDDVPLEHYEIQTEATQVVALRQLDLTTNAASPAITLSVKAFYQGDNKLQYELCCQDKVFNSATYGAGVFNEAARYLVQVRNSHENYPAYISDLDVPLALLGVADAGELHGLHLLQFKQKIESRLIA